MLISGFFNAEQIGADENGILYDRVYQAEFFSKYFSSFISNGIFIKEPNQLQVEQNTGMTLKIKGGRAFINGYFCYSDEDFNITLEPSDPLENRIDRIVLQFNLLERDIQAKILKGEPSSAPRPKDITRNENIYELALADITVNTGVSEITNANIKDLRLNNSLCGVSTHILDKIDTTGIYNQIQGDLNEFKTVNEENFNLWFEDLKSKLDENAIETHINGSIFDTNGVHNFRYNEETKKLEGFKEDSREWVKLRGLGEEEITLPNTTLIKARVTREGTKISWADAKDSIINGITLKKWYGTILVKKEGSPPLAYDDGEILFDNITRDKFLENPFIDTNIEKDKIYYYGLFPYDENYIYNTSFKNIVKVSSLTLENSLYSFIIDLNESNSFNNITYGDDAEEYETPESWDNSLLFQNIKPCLLKDGIVQYYLNPNDYELKENGEPSNLTGTDGDVMVEFPPLVYKGEFIEDRKFKITIAVNSENTPDDEWCKAHLDYNNNNFGKKIYHSVYISTVNGSTFSSIATNNTTYLQERIQNLINRAKAKNTTTFLTGIFDFNLLTILCWLRFKTTYLQRVFNLEIYNNLPTPRPEQYKIGSLTKGGLFSGCGSSAPQEAIKICGIEFCCNGYVKNNNFRTQGLMANIQQDYYTSTRFIYYISRAKMLQLGASIYRSNTQDHLYYSNSPNWGYINDFEFNYKVGIIPKYNSSYPNSTSSTYLTINADQQPSNCTPINYNLFAKNDNGFNMRPSRNGLQYTDQSYSTYFVYIPENTEEGRA